MDEDNGANSGAIAAVIVGTIVLLLLIVLLTYRIIKQGRAKITKVAIAETTTIVETNASVMTLSEDTDISKHMKIYSIFSKAVDDITHTK